MFVQRDPRRNLFGWRLAAPSRLVLHARHLWIGLSRGNFQAGLWYVKICVWMLTTSVDVDCLALSVSQHHIVVPYRRSFAGYGVAVAVIVVICFCIGAATYFMVRGQSVNFFVAGRYTCGVNVSSHVSGVVTDATAIRALSRNRSIASTMGRGHYTGRPVGG